MVTTCAFESSSISCKARAGITEAVLGDKWTLGGEVAYPHPVIRAKVIFLVMTLAWGGGANLTLDSVQPYCARRLKYDRACHISE